MYRLVQILLPQEASMRAREIVLLLGFGLVFWVAGTLWFARTGPHVFETTAIRYWVNFIVTPVGKYGGLLADFAFAADSRFQLGVRNSAHCSARNVRRSNPALSLLHADAENAAGLGRKVWSVLVRNLCAGYQHRGDRYLANRTITDGRSHRRHDCLPLELPLQ
jgi:hypothetical protein